LKEKNDPKVGDVLYPIVLNRLTNGWEVVPRPWAPITITQELVLPIPGGNSSDGQVVYRDEYNHGWPAHDLFTRSLDAHKEAFRRNREVNKQKEKRDEAKSQKGG